MNERKTYGNTAIILGRSNFTLSSETIVGLQHGTFLITFTPLSFI